MNSKYIKFSDWNDFPDIESDGKIITVSSVTYKGKTLKVGDKLTWIGFGQPIDIEVESIRLNPTIRVFCKNTNMYYLITQCYKKN